jgi:hypothetical protein
MDAKSHRRRTVLGFLAGGILTTSLSGCTETAAIHDVWGDVYEIVLEANTDEWYGIEPIAIEGELYPTIVLYEDHEYELTIQNGDGEYHVFEIPDEMRISEQNSLTAAVDGDQDMDTVQFKAVPSMTEYLCDPHGHLTRGQIDTQPESDTGVHKPTE